MKGRGATWSEYAPMMKVAEVARQTGGWVHVLGSGMHLLTLALLEAGVKHVSTVDHHSESTALFEQLVPVAKRLGAIWKHHETDAMKYLEREVASGDVFVIDPLWTSRTPFSF